MNFRKGLIAALLLTLVSNAFAQVSLKPSSQDLGNLRPGVAKSVKVKITNNSGVTLAISKPNTDCPCASAKIPVDLLKPGNSTWLAVKYLPLKDELGWKSVEVTFDYKPGGKSAAQVVPTGMAAFRFTANLVPETYQDPATINLGTIIPGKSAEGHGEIYLDPQKYPRWKVGRVQCDLAQFPTGFGALPEPGHYQVSLSVPATIAPGEYKGSILVLGATQKDKSFAYPFLVHVASRWKVAPPALNFNTTKPEKIKDWKAKTEMRFESPKAFKVLRVDGAPAWLKYDVQYQKPGNCVIQWRVDGGVFEKAKDKTFPKMLTVVTDQANEADVFMAVVSGAH